MYRKCGFSCFILNLMSFEGDMSSKYIWYMMPCNDNKKKLLLLLIIANECGLLEVVELRIQHYKALRPKLRFKFHIVTIAR